MRLLAIGVVVVWFGMMVVMAVVAVVKRGMRRR